MLALALSVALVLGATLHPSSYEGARGWDGCVLCGSRGLADAILNVGLFVPLGVSLAWMGVRWRWGVLLAAVLSAAVELAQLAVPGRDPSPPDLLFDALGTVAGLALARALPRLLRPGPVAAGRLSLAWSLLFAATVPLSAWLTAPSPAGSRVFAQWNAEVGGRPPYAGRLVGASLGSGTGALTLHPGPSPRPEAARRALRAGEPIRLRFSAAPSPPPRPATLLRLAGAGGSGLALVAIDGDDVLFGYRMRAADARLDAPLHRLSGLLRRVAPGETVELVLTREGRRVRGEVRAAEVARARSEPGPGRAWALLWFAAELPASVARLLDAVWLALWAAPLGLWARRRRAWAASVLLFGISLGAAGPLLGLGPASASAFVGAALGLVAGRAVGMGVGRSAGTTDERG